MTHLHRAEFKNNASCTSLPSLCDYLACTGPTLPLKIIQIIMARHATVVRLRAANTQVSFHVVSVFHLSL